MNKFEEMKKIRPIRNTWYVIHYIPEPIAKIVFGFKDKVISLLKTNTPKQTMYGRGKNKGNLKSKNN